MCWGEGSAAPNDNRSAEEIAKALCEQRKTGLGAWGIGEREHAAHSSAAQVRNSFAGSIEWWSLEAAMCAPAFGVAAGV
jgi:hypothetical protein